MTNENYESTRDQYEGKTDAQIRASRNLSWFIEGLKVVPKKYVSGGFIEREVHGDMAHSKRSSSRTTGRSN